MQRQYDPMRNECNVLQTKLLVVEALLEFSCYCTIMRKENQDLADPVKHDSIIK